VAGLGGGASLASVLNSASEVLLQQQPGVAARDGGRVAHLHQQLQDAADRQGEAGGEEDGEGRGLRLDALGEGPPVLREPPPGTDGRRQQQGQ
jgi:hypothetical protein